MDVYQKVTERPLGYTVLYLHPTSYDRKRAFSHLLTQEDSNAGIEEKEGMFCL